MKDERFADAIYHTYSAGIHSSKALLLDQKIQCNTQQGIIADFDKYREERFCSLNISSFSDLILQIQKNEPSRVFAEKYYLEINDFVNKAKEFRGRDAMHPVSILE